MVHSTIRLFFYTISGCLKCNAIFKCLPYYLKRVTKKKNQSIIEFQLFVLVNLHRNIS